MEIANRQWRALAQAYPFFCTVSSLALTPAEGANDPVGETSADASMRRAEFAQYVVPRARKAFGDELTALEDAIRNGNPPATTVARHSSSNDAGGATTTVATAAAEALLTHLFGRPPTFRVCEAVDDSSLSSVNVSSSLMKWTPLTPRELQLLALYHRKQEQYEHVFLTRQQLLEASQAAVQTLQSVSQPLRQYNEAGTWKEAVYGDGKSLHPTRESLLWLGGGGPAAAAAFAAVSSPQPPQREQTTTTSARDSAYVSDSTFTSALASVPYTDATRAAPNLAAEAENSLSRVSNNNNNNNSIAAMPPLLMFVNRCAGCGEAGGDLMACTQCGEIRHEACGGPHPPEPSRVDGSLPAINVCRQCAKDLNLSTSSSSLRSSTSTEERVELDAYFDSDNEETESSLSGFVVHSSEEDAEGSADEEGEEGESSKKSAEEEEEERSGAKRDKKTRDSSPPASSSPSHRNEDTEATKKRKGTQRKRAVKARRQRRGRASERESNNSSSSNASDGSSDADEISPRRQQKKHARKETERVKRTPHDSGSEEEDVPASGASTTASSASSRSKAKKSHEKKNGGKNRGEPSSSLGKKSTAPPSKKSSHNGVHKAGAPISSQDRRRVQDEEEDELSVLGLSSLTSPNPQHHSSNTYGSGSTTASDKTGNIAPSSAPFSASPRSNQASRQQRGSATEASNGRRSFVDLASSSSNESD